MSGSVGLVPTMGYLHEGHLSLVRRARADSDHLIVSSFVNPTQFGPSEDYERYPRDPHQDRRLLLREGVDVLFAPPAEEMYPEWFESHVDPGPGAAPLEGAHRPGHFQGVATVVLKLFNVIQPGRAYFGQKDAQQLAVIRRLVRDLDVPDEVVGLPTVGEADGLAMSSRNAYLSPEERRAATVLYRALRLAERLYNEGERDASLVRRQMLDLLATEVLAGVDYVSIADPGSMVEMTEVRPPVLVSLAVRIGDTRLIDNVVVE